MTRIDTVISAVIQGHKCYICGTEYRSSIANIPAGTMNSATTERSCSAQRGIDIHKRYNYLLMQNIRKERIYSDDLRASC